MRKIYAASGNLSHLETCLLIAEANKVLCHLVLAFRWLDKVFQGQYLPSLSINYVAIKKIWINCHHSCIR